MPRQIHFKDGATWRQLGFVYYNDAGTWRTLTQVHINDAGTWRQVFPDVVNHTLSKSGDASGSATTTVSGGNVAATTNSVTITPIAGVGPFTYSWSHVGGTAATANSSTSATTTFTRTAAAPSVNQTSNNYSGTMRCTVTDTGNGNYATSIDVTVSTTHTYAIHTLSKSGDAYGSDQTGTPGGNVTVTTDTVTITPSGGVGPYTYSWAYVSGSTFTVNSPSSAATSFTKTAAAPTIDGNFNRFTGVYRCTVTDTGNGNVQNTIDVNVTTDHYYLFA